MGAQLTMSQCALYTKTIALGRKHGSGAAGEIKPAMIIENRELAKTKASCTGELESAVACQLLQTLGLILHKENARAILRRSAPLASVDHLTLAVVNSLQSADAEQHGLSSSVD